MAGFILFQLLCVVAPDIEVGNVYVNVLLGITLVSGVVFGAGLAVIAAALIVGAVIAFCLQHLPQKVKGGVLLRTPPFLTQAQHSAYLKTAVTCTVRRYTEPRLLADLDCPQRRNLSANQNRTPDRY